MSETETGFNEQDAKQHMIMQNIARGMDNAFYRSMRTPETIPWNSQMPRASRHRTDLLNPVDPLPVPVPIQ